MTCYRVSFFKDLISSDGHRFRCTQWVIEIRHARSADRAVKAAELRYERLHRVHDWTLHANCLELEVDGNKVDYCPTDVKAVIADRTPLLPTPAVTAPTH
jgi:hypothetical protein